MLEGVLPTAASAAPGRIFLTAVCAMPEGVLPIAACAAPGRGCLQEPTGATPVRACLCFCATPGCACQNLRTNRSTRHNSFLSLRCTVPKIIINDLDT